MPVRVGCECVMLTLDLRGLRREAGLTLQAWERLCGVAESNLARYEAGAVPGLLNALKIARFLKMPVEEIWGLEEEE